MAQVKALQGNCKITQNGETIAAILTIDMENQAILVQGNLQLARGFRADIREVASRNISITDIQLFTPHGTLRGSFGPVRVVSVLQRGGSFHYTGSQLAQLLSVAPEYNHDTLKVITDSSLLEFSLYDTFIEAHPTSLLDKLKRFFTIKRPRGFLRDEIWFADPRKRVLEESNVTIGEKACRITSRNGSLSVSSQNPIADHEAACFRVCFSFYFGAETKYLFRANGERFLVNLVESDVPTALTLIPADSFASFVECFMDHALSLSVADFETLQNQMGLYVAGRSARIAMNARMAMLFIGIESIFAGREEMSMQAKIQNLFNLDDPRNPGYHERTVSNSMTAQVAGALSRIRNLVVHEGFMVEQLQEHCARNNVLQCGAVEALLRDMGIPLWRFLLSNLDRYWLNRIRFRGTFLDVHNDFEEVQTIR